MNVMSVRLMWDGAIFGMGLIGHNRETVETKILLVIIYQQQLTAPPHIILTEITSLLMASFV